MVVNRYSGSEILEPTAGNFPALKNFWDMNHISGADLLDTIGGQHATASAGQWYVDSEGFAKWEINGGQTLPGDYEAPGDRDFMLIGCGLVSFKTRAVTIGQYATLGADPVPAGVAFELSHPAPVSPSAFYDTSNYSNSELFSFSDQLSSSMPSSGENIIPDPANRGVKGCFATVVSPAAGTVKGYWAGRTGETASYDPGYEEVTYTMTGSVPGTWPALGAGWTMYPGNRFEWVALMYFDSGAPLDMEEAMRWMAQYDDIRLYPGWIGLA